MPRKGQSIQWDRINDTCCVDEHLPVLIKRPLDFKVTSTRYLLFVREVLSLLFWGTLTIGAIDKFTTLCCFEAWRLSYSGALIAAILHCLGKEEKGVRNWKHLSLGPLASFNSHIRVISLSAR